MTRPTRRDREAAVRAHPAFLYSYAPTPKDVRYVFVTTDATITKVGLTEAFHWVKDQVA